MKYFLILGSNYRRAYHLRLAFQSIKEIATIKKCSRVWRTRGENSRRYLNAGVMIREEVQYDTLRVLLRNIEMRAGRIRGSDICTLDIDIVAAEDDARNVNVFKPLDLNKDYVKRILDELGKSAS